MIIQLACILTFCSLHQSTYNLEPVPPQTTATESDRTDRDLLKPERDGFTPLHRAIYEDKPLNEIIELIESGSDINQRIETRRTQRGYNAIHLAARYHTNPDLLYVLVNHGADIESRDSISEMTPLMLAAAYASEPEIFTTLVDLGADLLAQRHRLQTAYQYSVQYNNNVNTISQVLKTYREREIIPENWPDPIVHAVQSENILAVDFLLENGSDPNFFSTNDGYPAWTPLMIASEKNNPELCLKLINAGADPNLPTPEYHTPLSKAARSHKNQRTIRLLLEHGANPNGTNKDGLTSFMLASKHGKYPDNLRLLIEHGADPNAIDPDGWKPIHHAVMGNSRSEILGVLLEHGADVDERTLREKMTPLMICVKMNKSDKLIPELIELGADVNAEAEGGVTAIFLAPNNRPEVAQMIIDAGADINHRIKGGVTPLMIASFQPMMGVAHVFLDAGADPTAKDERGLTALDYAKRAKMKDHKLIQRLEALMIDG